MKMNQLAAAFPPECISINGALVQVRTAGQSLDYIIGIDGELWLMSNNLASTPPAGCFAVKNLYVDASGKLIVQWDNGV